MYSLWKTTFVIFSNFGRLKNNLEYKVHNMEIYFKLSDTASLRGFYHLNARL